MPLALACSSAPRTITQGGGRPHRASGATTPAATGSTVSGRHRDRDRRHQLKQGVGAGRTRFQEPGAERPHPCRGGVTARLQNAQRVDIVGSDEADEGEVEKCRGSVSPMEAPAEVIDGRCGKTVRRKHRENSADQDLGFAADMHHEAARRCCICPQTIEVAACSCGRVNTRRAWSSRLNWQRAVVVAGW